MSSRYWGAVRALRQDVVLFLAAWFVVQFCFSGLYSVLLNLFVLRLGYGPAFVGRVHAGMALGFVAFALPAGILGGRLGYRRAILVGLSANTVLSALIPAAVLTSGSQQRALLLTPYGLYGFFLTFIIVNGVAFLANTSQKDTRPLVFSLYTATPPIAGFVGCLTAGFLPGLAGVVPVAALLVVGFLRSTLVQALPTFFNVHLDTDYRAPTSLIGLLMSAARLLSAPAALLAPLLIKAVGARRSVIAAGTTAALLVLPIAMAPGIVPAATTLIGVLTLAGLHNCAFTTFAQETTAPEWRSVVSGAVFTAGGVSLVGVSYGGGRVMASLGYRPMVAATGVFMLAGVLIFALYFSARRVAALTAQP